MVQVVEPPKRRHPNLILHCGAHAVELNQVQEVQTPRSTATWTPIPHIGLIRQVQQALAAAHLRIGTQAHSLTHDGMRYFGLMEVHGHQLDREDYSLVMGLRNSHDKRFPAGIVTGSSVFVCDNLSFSGEIELSRKHTRFITRDLPQLVSRAVGLLGEKWYQQDRRIEAYKRIQVGEEVAHDLVIRSVDAGVCANSYIPDVLQEWRKPKHEVFEQRNVWSLFNSFTEALKQGSLAELPKRTQALHGLLDSHVGLGQN